jgi:hypothetical protein
MHAINFDKALRTILTSVEPLPAENIVLGNAFGRVAAARIAADLGRRQCRCHGS